MKRLFVFLFFASAAFAQGQQHLNFAFQNIPNTAVGSVIRAVPSAVITVCAANSSGIPCTPALSNTLFSNSSLSLPLTNPTFADANGNFFFYAAPGTYTVTVTGTGVTGYSYQLSLGPFLGGNNTWTGTQTYNGAAVYNSTVTFNGGMTFAGPVTFSAGGTFNGSFAGNPTWTGTQTFTNSTVFNGQVSLSNGGTISGAFSGSSSQAGNWTFAGIVNVVEIQSHTASPALTGLFRLAKTDTFNWRNNANSADLALSLSNLDVLTWPNPINIGGGSTITIYKQASAAITPGSVNATTCAEQSFNPAAFSIFATTDIPFVSSNTILNQLAFPVNYRINASGTLGITYCNPTAGPLTPTASTVTVTTFH